MYVRTGKFEQIKDFAINSALHIKEENEKKK